LADVGEDAAEGGICAVALANPDAAKSRPADKALRTGKAIKFLSSFQKNVLFQTRTEILQPPVSGISRPAIVIAASSTTPNVVFALHK
jgi:hypothetical protein